MRERTGAVVFQLVELNARNQNRESTGLGCSGWSVFRAFADVKGHPLSLEVSTGRIA